MKKLLFISKGWISIMLFFGITFISYSQAYDMSYLTFAKYIKEEMTDKEFKSIDDYFGGNVSGIVCFYEYGDFSGDSLDEFVVLTYENSPEINIYVFQGTDKGTFEFIDKVTYPYWRSRYEVSILIKNRALFVTNADSTYENWTWNIYRIGDDKLNLVKKQSFQ
ncbi:MAG TPA: hypothetical protein VGK25_14270 [Ignavibacteria bacterium]|jgi:hypothetical protein